MEAVLRLLVSSLIYIISAGITLWTAGALFYDVGRAAKMAWLLAFLWVAAVIAIFVTWSPLWKPFLLLLALFSLFLAWWFSQKPSNDRQWQAATARLARITIDGDAVVVEDMRVNEYRTLNDFTPLYETRVYHLSRLCGVDAVITNWGSRWMTHPMFVFDFGSDGRVCFSIEVRYRCGQRYNLLRSLYRQQELIYVVCDERDAILRRTKYSQGQTVYLYRIVGEMSEIRRFLLEYVKQVNAVFENPVWYHGLSANCTTSIYTQGRGRIVWDWRLLFNGKLDRMLYDRKRLDQRLPFATLRQQSRVNEYANRAPREGFGDFIRRELSGYDPS